MQVSVSMVAIVNDVDVMETCMTRLTPIMKILRN